MNTVVVDDRQLAVNALLKMLLAVDPEGTHIGFVNPEDALQYQASHSVDAAFLDIEMPGRNGLLLATDMQRLNPRINIVYVTGHREYALEAHHQFVSGYLMKPVRKEELVQVLKHLRFPVESDATETALPAVTESAATPQEKVPGMGSPLRIRCFGNFEVFFRGVPLHFKRSKTKELLAYLVDRRGSICTMGELIAILWEDRPDSASLRTQLRNLIHDLKETLQGVGCEQVLIRRWNELSIDVREVDCDYYNYLRKAGREIDQYRGEYMRQYSWAETTHAAIEEAQQKS